MSAIRAAKPILGTNLENSLQGLAPPCAHVHTLLCDASVLLENNRYMAAQRTSSFGSRA
jgi:hypothetical protein